MKVVSDYLSLLAQAAPSSEVKRPFQHDVSASTNSATLGCGGRIPASFRVSLPGVVQAIYRPVQLPVFLLRPAPREEPHIPVLPLDVAFLELAHNSGLGFVN